MTYFNKLRIRSLFVIALFSSQVFAQHVSYRSFDHYNDKVAEFERMSDIDSTDIVMLGNSLTEYAGDWSKLLKYGHVKNRGIAGDDAEGIYQRLNQILPRRPKAVFLMVGINDISHGLTASEVFEKCQKVIDKIWAHRRYTKLYVQSILPINETFDQWKNLEGKTDEVAAVNKLLRHYCMRNNITYINLFKDFNRHETNEMRKPLTCDGLHLTPIGYKVWAFRLNRYL